MLLLEALEQLIARPNYQVLLVIRLATTPVSAAGMNFDRHALEDAVGVTPPSFYWFPRPSNVVTQTVQVAAKTEFECGRRAHCRRKRRNPRPWQPRA